MSLVMQEGDTPSPSVSLRGGQSPSQLHMEAAGQGNDTW